MTPASSIPLDSARSRSDAETSPVPVVTQDAIRALARQVGFIEAGMVNLPHVEADRDAARFEQWIKAGRSGTMEYLARRDEKQELVRSRVSVPFPWARSAVVCLAGYHSDAPLSTEPAAPGSGWIARYAWSGRKDPTGNVRPSDYHKVLLKRLRALEAEMHSAFGDFECRAYVDTGPVVERSIARAAGLGWTGKNTCLIHPKLGSWNFLAVLVTSLPLAAEQAPLAIPDRCGSCRRCLDACPTQALVDPYQMDATRCISYLTIEHRGEIAEELRAGMGRQVFGCDICQDVCPWNRKAPIAVGSGSALEFGPSLGLGMNEHSGLAPRRELVNPSLEWLAGLELADFERLFNGSPIRRAGFLGLRRNIAIAMGNSGLERYLPWLERWARNGQDRDGLPEPGLDAELGLTTLQEAAQWALRLIAPGGKHGETR